MLNLMWERRSRDYFGYWVTMASEDVVEPTSVSQALCDQHIQHWHRSMLHEIDLKIFFILTITVWGEGTIYFTSPY